jgi:hypothetical protein
VEYAKDATADSEHLERFKMFSEDQNSSVNVQDETPLASDAKSFYF